MEIIFESFSYIDLIMVIFPIGGLIIGLSLFSRLENPLFKCFIFTGIPLFSLFVALFYFRLRSNSFQASWNLFLNISDIGGGFIFIIFTISFFWGVILHWSEGYFKRQKIVVEEDTRKKQAYGQINFSQVYYYVQVIIGWILSLTSLAWAAKSEWLSSVMFGAPNAMDCLKFETVQLYNGSIDSLSVGCTLRLSNILSQTGVFISNENWEKFSHISGVLSFFLALIVALAPEHVTKIAERFKTKKIEKSRLDNVDNSQNNKAVDQIIRAWNPKLASSRGKSKANEDDDLIDPRVKKPFDEEAEQDNDDWQGYH